ncbi:hypothetical protein JTX29_001918 [Escherichia coli]|nr:hypothetical protein [Escherichia coli]
MKGTIFAVALNHRSQLDAWQEAFQQSPYKAPPKTAVWFIKPRNTVIGCGEPIPFPQGEKVLSGATVALIVGKTATKVREEDAAEYIAGYALANDVSLPEESFYRPAIKAKCRDGFCPIGETVALSNVDNLTIYTEINGRPADHWNTADLQRNAAQLLSALSEFATLNPGDAILLGTPQARVEIQPGDRVRVLAEGFPPLENPVVDEREVTTRKSFPTQPHPHGTLFALGLNYADHASELEFKPPEEPLVFLKAPNTLTGDNQTSVRPNNIEYMHYEAELVVVIGKQARNVSEAILKAIEQYDGTVAVLASGSLSHRFIDDQRAEEGMNSYTREFDRQMDERVVKLWREGQFKEFCNMLPEYADYCYGEGNMHDTVMLLGMLGWDKYDGKVEFITELFPSSGTGQVNAVFPLPA